MQPTNQPPALAVCYRYRRAEEHVQHGHSHHRGCDRRRPCGPRHRRRHRGGPLQEEENAEM